MKNVKHPEALAGLAERYGLSPAQQAQLGAVLDALERTRGR